MGCVVLHITRKFISERCQQNTVGKFGHKFIAVPQTVGGKLFSRIINAVSFFDNVPAALFERLGKVIWEILIGQTADKLNFFKAREILFQAENRFSRP